MSEDRKTTCERLLERLHKKDISEIVRDAQRRYDRGEEAAVFLGVSMSTWAKWKARYPLADEEQVHA
jgi:hypothetical protein